VAARCSIPYEALVTLNGFRSAEEQLAGRSILLPAGPGLYVAEVPQNEVEQMVRQSHPLASLLWASTAGDNADGAAAPSAPSAYVGVEAGGRRFAWSGTARFTPEARFFFLDPSFIFPVEGGQVSSPYGNRLNPLDNKTWQFHPGVDIAAPTGTAVMAARSGVVERISEDAVRGIYVLLKHSNGTESLYGHLSEVRCAAGAAVSRGDVIGLVGSTGQSTGPHLHFEIRDGTTTRNPAEVIRGGLDRN
jgi:murein DD-endopeptidase MepM/ murein hydrolase activator NlpD